MGSAKSWIANYRTPIAAAIFTAVLLGFVFAGKLEMSRAVVALTFCWTLAMHSLDNNAHKAEIVDGLQKVERAGVEFRGGDKAGCLSDLQAAGKVAEQLAHEIHDEQHE